MNKQMQDFVEYVRSEMLSRMQHMGQAPSSAMVPLRRPVIVAGTKGRRDGQNSGSETK
jgi:MerR family transcriptional regulator/heat shock protein HspR